MYLGSVKFFKHVIYMTMALILWAVFFGLYFLGNQLVDNPAVSTQTAIVGAQPNPVGETVEKAPQDAGGTIVKTTTGVEEDIDESLAPFIAVTKQSVDESMEESVGGALEEFTEETTARTSVEINEIQGITRDQSVDLSQAEVLSRLKLPEISRIGYQLKYPDLYSEIPEELIRTKKTAYLTFDDGPSVRTLEILDILREHDVKATFFVVTEDANPDILRAIVAEGHAIGVHTNTHRYREIYRSVEDFLDDFYTAYMKIYEATSVKPEIFRFPGGSINAYNRGIYQELISEMLRRGFLYYDWNVSCMDANPSIAPKEIVETIKSTVNGQDRLVILAHDSTSKHQTVEALPEIIEYIREAGYTFERFDKFVEPVVFVYPTY